MSGIKAMKSFLRDGWADTPVGAVAWSIVSLIEERIAEGETGIGLGEILNALGLKKASGDVTAALALLTQSERAILRAEGVFRDAAGVAHRVSGAAFQRVLEEDILVHPVTGKMVKLASRRVYPVFAITAAAAGGPVPACLERGSAASEEAFNDFGDF